MGTPSQSSSPPRIFVSHSHEDDDFCRRLVADLRAAGAAVWVDLTGMDPGNFMARISQALDDSDWLVLVLTPAAIGSNYVRLEVDAALHRVQQGYMRGLIPVLAEECPPRSVPALWDVLHRLDATRDYETALIHLLKTLGLSQHARKSRMNLILLGPQGSGKGTQGELLARDLHLKPVASGGLLRAAMAAGTPLGLRAKPYYNAGDLVPDDIVISLILESMRQLGDARGIILDGFVHNIPQAEALDRALAASDQCIDAVVYLEVPRLMLEERLVNRYVCEAQGHVWNIKTHPPRVLFICDYDGSPLMHLSEDTPDKIARRLNIFFTETIQLIPYYARQGKLVTADGTRDIAQVNQAIIGYLHALLPAEVPPPPSIRM